jgi:hypothetical protein
VAVPVRRGPPSECARAHLAPDKGYNTHSTLWCTPQPWRSPPSRRFWLGQFIALASFLSRCHVCGSEVVLSSIGVLSCRAFLFVTRDGAGARRMFQDVDVDVSSARRLASLHAGFPVHVWRCRRPSPRGGRARCAERPPPRPWLPRVAGGAATLDRVHAPKGPSSFSAVRRQVWLNYPTTHPTPRGERSSLDTDSRACAARSRRLLGVRLASSIWLVCDFGPSRIFRVTGWLGVVGLGGRWAGFSSVGLRLVRLLFLFRLGCWSVCSSLSISVVGWATSSVCRSLVWVGVGLVACRLGRRASGGWWLGAAVVRAVSLSVQRRASWGVCTLSCRWGLWGAGLCVCGFC